MKNIIYKHTNKINGKSYIGKTKSDIFKRLDEHIRSSERGSNNLFHKAIRKYGIENFISEVIEENIETAEVNEREIYWINIFNSFSNGYNMTKGGDGGDTISKKENFEPTKNFGDKNGRSRSMKIYNKENELLYICEGNYIEISKEIGIGYYHFQKSANNFGMPIYNKGDRKFDGMYCVDEKIGYNPKKWKYDYLIKNSNGEIEYEILQGYKLSEFLIDNSLPIGLLKSTKENPLYYKCRPQDLTKHKKSGNIQFKGWYIERKGE